MAIRYSTYIGHGYYISNDEYFAIVNKQNFLRSKYTIPTNKLNSLTTDYFFGIKMESIIPGHGFCFPSSWNLDEEELTTMKETFKSFYPNKSDYKSKDYIITEIEEID